MRTVHLSYGDEPAEEYGWQMTTDLAVHGWDLATALGADAGIPDELATALLAYIEPQLSLWSGSSMFAEPVRCPTTRPADAARSVTRSSAVGRTCLYTGQRPYSYEE